MRVENMGRGYGEGEWEGMYGVGVRSIGRGNTGGSWGRGAWGDGEHGEEIYGDGGEEHGEGVYGKGEGEYGDGGRSMWRQRGGGVRSIGMGNTERGCVGVGVRHMGSRWGGEHGEGVYEGHCKGERGWGA
jgi:hypothetical protein